MEKEVASDDLSSEEQAFFTPPEEDAPAEAPEQTADAEEQAPPEQGEKPDEGAEQEPEPERPQNRMVDYRALQEARNELRQEREQRARLEERVNMILQQVQPRQEPEQEAPEPSELEPFDPNKHDIFDYVQKQTEEIRRLRDWRQETEQQRQAREQQEAQVRAVEDFRNRLGAHEQQFAQQNPDYFDRINAYIEQEVPRLAVLSGRAAVVGEAQARQEALEHLRNNLLGTAYQLSSQGQDPAAYFYHALSNYAPQPSQAEPAPAEPQTPPEDKFQSLKGGSSSKARVPKSYADLNNMSDDEFMKAVEDGVFEKIASGR